LNELFFAIGGRSFDAPHPAFDLQLQVSRAGTVSAEAEFESMVQMLQAETIRTSLVGSIQKRALGGGFGHTDFFRRTALSSALRDGLREGDKLSEEKRMAHAEAQRRRESYWVFFFAPLRLCVRLFFIGLESSGCGCGVAAGAVGHLLGLETDGDEQVLQAFQRLAVEKIGGEINRE
jgi:hypothetical protein